MPRRDACHDLVSITQYVTGVAEVAACEPQYSEF